MPLAPNHETVKAIRFTLEAVQHSRESIQMLQAAIVKSHRAIALTKERLQTRDWPGHLERTCEPERQRGVRGTSWLVPARPSGCSASRCLRHDYDCHGTDRADDS